MPPAETVKKIMMLVAPNQFWEEEYFAPRTLFDEQGFGAEVFSEGERASGVQGTEIVTRSVDEADHTEFDGLFVSGGKGMIAFSKNARAQRLLRKFLRAEKPVALLCHAPLLAAEAGAVAGRRITGWPAVRSAMKRAGAEWTGMPVERDGLLFTGVGPDDSESLAFALAAAIRGRDMLARSEAMLDSESAFRKLAAVYRVGDMIAMGADEDDIEAELEKLRGLEEEEFVPSAKKEPDIPDLSELVRKPSTPAVPDLSEIAKKPSAPPVTPTVPPVAEPAPEPTPEPTPEPVPAPPKRGTFSFKPPRSDGLWPDPPAVPPPGFPLPSAQMGTEEELNALFKNPETWSALSEAALNPAKMAALQQYLVPHIVLTVGKDWWDRNKRRSNLRGAPFGVFEQGEPKGKSSSQLDDMGRGYIAAINWYVADILGKYMSTKGPEGDIVGYTYAALHNRMVMEAAKTFGFRLEKQPACAYCRWRLGNSAKPPKLEKGTGSAVKKRQFYRCPRCADTLTILKDQIRQHEGRIGNARQAITDAEERMREIGERLSRNPEDQEARSAFKSYEDMIQEWRSSITSWERSRQELAEDIWKRERLVSVPYQHLVCINEECPGVRIPLTFVDWSDEKWQRGPEGERRRKLLQEQYGIVPPGSEQQQQEADDVGVAGPAPASGTAVPPRWLWNVKFVCPYDNLRFTPAEAFGKGKRNLSGQPLGGMLVDAPRTNMWSKPFSLRDPGEEKPGMAEIRSTTDVRSRSDSSSVQADRTEAMFYKDLSDSVRMELLRRKEEHAKEFNPGQARPRSRRLYDLQQFLYDAALEWSIENPVEMTAFIAGRQVKTVNIYDKDKETIKEHRKIQRLRPGAAAAVSSALIQRWFSKVMQERKDWFSLLKLWLTSYTNDKIYPDSYFISTVEQESGETLTAKCRFKYGKDSPLGEQNPRNKEATRGNYGKRPNIALLLGAWRYAGKPSREQMMTPIAPEEGERIVAGSENLNSAVSGYDYQEVRFDAASTALKAGDAVIMRGLFMPRHTAWRPVKLVSFLRKDMGDDDPWGIMGNIGNLAEGSEHDERMLLQWRKKMKQMGLPMRLEEFDRALKGER